MKTRKLIVAVDDDPKMLALLKIMLHGGDYILLSKDGAESVLHLLDKIHIDLFLIDIMMPNMNGFDLCKALRAHDNVTNTPIVLLSAHRDTPQAQQQAEEVGASKYLSKSNIYKELVPTITNILYPCQHSLQ